MQLAAEELLAWPPHLQYGRPHPAVLGRHTDQILTTCRSIHCYLLISRRLSFWFASMMYYLVAGLPTQAWISKAYNCDSPPTNAFSFAVGPIGIFDDVFFLEGSPLYEVDLLQGCVLQAR
jgi:hypothetical protein